MALYIAAVRLAPSGTGVEHITELIWMSHKHNSGKCPVATVIATIDNTPGSVVVSDGTTEATVEVVRPQGRQPYIRSERDRSKKDNLLALPRY